jgi:UDP-3-O-[3-hydroxymyristoyl] glucosamine N-acyltransferase
MSNAFSLSEIAEWVGGTVRGDAGTMIDGVSGIPDATPGKITWLASEKYQEQLATCKASAVVVPRDYGETPMPAILVDVPPVAIAQILAHFAPPVTKPAPGQHHTAIVDESVSLGANVCIGALSIIGSNATIGDRTIIHDHVHIGAEVTIGADCEIWPGVVIRERCTLADRVIVHPNTTIGSDGFGYEFVDGKHMKIPQIGTVEIESDVEIGANCSIDRAKFGGTRIGAGTKIDNQVQVAHNVQIGPACILVAQCGIAGSTRLGTGVVLGGKVGVRDHLVLGDGMQSAACACISKDVPAGTTVFGIPAQEYRHYLKERADLRRVPTLKAQIEALMKRVEALETAADDRKSG